MPGRRCRETQSPRTVRGYDLLTRKLGRNQSGQSPHCCSFASVCYGSQLFANLVNQSTTRSVGSWRFNSPERRWQARRREATAGTERASKRQDSSATILRPSTRTGLLSKRVLPRLPIVRPIRSLLIARSGTQERLTREREPRRPIQVARSCLGCRLENRPTRLASNFSQSITSGSGCSGSARLNLKLRMVATESPVVRETSRSRSAAGTVRAPRQTRLTGISSAISWVGVHLMGDARALRMDASGRRAAQTSPPVVTGFWPEYSCLEPEHPIYRKRFRKHTPLVTRSPTAQFNAAAMSTRSRQCQERVRDSAVSL